MNTQLLTSIDQVYKQSSIHAFKTLEQRQSDYEKELKVVSDIFEIDDLEALFLIAIVINNTEYKNCQLEDIANQLNISKFEILDFCNRCFLWNLKI